MATKNKGVGRPKVAVKVVHINTQIKPDMLAFLTEKAESENVSRSSLITKLIYDHYSKDLAKWKRKKKK